MLTAHDAAYAPDLGALRRVGSIAVNGYLTGKYATTTTQPAAARAAGLGYVATYEEGPSELVGASRYTGRRVGDKIMAAWRAKGLPLGPEFAVYPSVDVNAAAGSCDNGWQGIRDVIQGEISLRSYADGAIIDHLTAARLVDGKCWLAAPTSWPGYRLDDPNVCMIQMVGTDVPGTDRNHIVTDPHALGAWWPDGSPYATGGLTVSEIAEIMARFDRIDKRLTALNQVDVNGDHKPDLTGTVQGAVQYAIRDLTASVHETQQMVAALPTRLAALQAAVAAIKLPDVAVDTAAVVTGVLDGLAAKFPAFPGLTEIADAVATRVKTLSWKAAE